MTPAIRMPFQKALKLPATRPERIVNDAPPSREAVTISCTGLECELVKTLVNSGISTAARVPQLMIVASWNHRYLVSMPATSILCINNQLMPYDVRMHSADAMTMRRVRGASKLNSLSPLYL